MMVCVPENPENNLPLFRRDQSDSDGTFTLPDVLPGRYRILAIENGWDLEWGNAAILKPRLEHADSVNVATGHDLPECSQRGVTASISHIDLFGSVAARPP
jgi:hypothetical protein